MFWLTLEYASFDFNRISSKLRDQWKYNGTHWGMQFGGQLKCMSLDVIFLESFTSLWLEYIRMIFKGIMLLIPDFGLSKVSWRVSNCHKKVRKLSLNGGICFANLNWISLIWHYILIESNLTLQR